MKNSIVVFLALIIILLAGGCSAPAESRAESVSAAPKAETNNNEPQTPSEPPALYDSQTLSEAPEPADITEQNTDENSHDTPPESSAEDEPDSPQDDETSIKPPKPSKAPEQADAPESHKYEIRARVTDSMPDYRFVATGSIQGTEEWMYGFVLGLDVYDETGALILSEDFSEVMDDGIVGYHVYNEMMDTMGLHVVDVNFDGYKDVIILNAFAGAHGNTWYDCWLWDTETSTFVASESFAGICNPALDPEKKCIYSAGGSGAAYWGGKIYRFLNGEFIVTNELDTDWERLTETKLVNGKTEIVREVFYGEDEKIIRDEQEYYRNNALWQLDNPRWYWVGGHHADQWLD